MARMIMVTHDGTSHEPLGMEYVAAALYSRGHEVTALPQSAMLAEFRDCDFVGFQTITGDEGRWGRVAQTVKERYPQVQAIFGGPHYLFFSKTEQPEADIVIRGDGEIAVLAAVEGRPHEDLRPIEDLDSLPHPDRGLFYNDRFPAVRDNPIRNFIACRGCPYKCEYCYNSNKEWQSMVGAGKLRLRYHSPEWIIEDIKRTFRDYGGQFVSFQDDIFGIDLEWLEEFVRRYQAVRIPFFAQLRPALITEERVKLLKEANIHIASFAIESGNEETRAEILDRHESNEMILNGCRILHKHGVRFRMQNMLGLPVDEPLEDALETLRFNIRCRPALSWVSMLQAYPGTAIAERVVRKGLVKSMGDLRFMVNATFFEECSLPIKDKTKIERLHAYWSAVVRWPWLYRLVTQVLIHLDLGKRFHRWLFEKTKGYINSREYWRTTLSRHVTLDRLGNEPERVRQVKIP